MERPTAMRNTEANVIRNPPLYNETIMQKDLPTQKARISLVIKRRTRWNHQYVDTATSFEANYSLIQSIQYNRRGRFCQMDLIGIGGRIVSVWHSHLFSSSTSS